MTTTLAIPMKTSNLAAYGLLLAAPLMWAGNAVVGRGLLHDVGPIALAFWRWTLAFLILLPFTWRAMLAQRHVLRQHRRAVLLFAVFGIVAFNAFQYIALTTRPVVNTVLIASSLPVLLMPLTMIFLKEAPSRRALCGVIFSLAGILLVTSRGQLQTLQQLDVARGDLFMLLAVLAWAAYTLLLRVRPLPMPMFVSLSFQIGVGILILLPFYLGELATRGSFKLSSHTGTALLYLALFPSVLAYICWSRGVQAIGASRAAIFMNFTPVFGSILAVLFLDESFHAYQAVALCLLIGGVVLSNRPRTSP